MPRMNRPGARSATVAADMASVAGPRVNTLAMAVPSRIPVASATGASEAKQSRPSASYDQASV